MPSCLRTFARFALALALLPACGPAAAGKAAAKVAADAVVAEDLAQLDALAALVDAEVAGTADAGKDAEEVATDTQDVPVDVSEGTVSVHTAFSTLIPPPLSVDVTASVAGVEVTADCAWTASPPEVCALVSAHAVRKVGDGMCVVTCTLPGGKWGAKGLLAKKQSVLYQMGGTAIPDTMNLRITRFRVTDNEWDDVGTLPNSILAETTPPAWLGKPTVVGGNGAIYLVGGYQHFYVDAAGTEQVPDGVCVDKAGQPACQGSWWRYDLTTGIWTKMGTLQPNRGDDAVVRVGTKAYFVGGLPSPPWALVLDLPTETLTPMPTADPGLQEIPALVPWNGDVLMVFGKGITRLLKPDGTLLPIDTGLPVQTDPGAFLVPGAPVRLFVDASTPSPSIPCKPNATQSWAVGLWFWRLDPTGWTKVDGYCAHSGIRDLWTPDGDLAIPAGSFSGSHPFEPVRRLATPDGKWEELAPVTHWRTDFGAAVVQQ